MPEKSTLLSFDDIAELDEYLKSCKEMYGLFKDQTFTNIFAEYAISEESSKRIYDMEQEVIDSLTYQNLDEILETLEIDKSKVKTRRQKGYMGGETFLEFIKGTFTDIKTRVADVVAQKENMESLIKDVNDAKQSTIDYVNSDEFVERKNQYYRKQLESLKDEGLSLEEKEKVKTELTFMDNLESCAFVYDRLERVGTKEVQRVMDHFFKDTLGEYMMHKFNGSCKKFHIGRDIYRYFLNLEETFLPEEYHPFNNLFLFVCIRYISYADDRNSNERDYVHRLINNLVFLYNHKFPTKEREEKFIDTIQRVCQFFFPYKETFITKNVTYKEHPERLRREELVKRREKSELMKTLKLKGIEFSPNDSIEDLKAALDKFEEEKKEKERLEVEASQEEPSTPDTDEESSDEEESPQILEIDEEVLPEVPEFNLEDYSIQQISENVPDENSSSPVDFVVEQINPE